MTPTNPDSPDNQAKDKLHSELAQGTKPDTSELDRILISLLLGESFTSSYTTEALRKQIWGNPYLKEAKAALLKWAAQEANKRELKLIRMALACEDEGWGTPRDYLEHRLSELTAEKDSSDDA